VRKSFFLLGSLPFFLRLTAKKNGFNHEKTKKVQNYFRVSTQNGFEINGTKQKTKRKRLSAKSSLEFIVTATDSYIFI